MKSLCNKCRRIKTLSSKTMCKSCLKSQRIYRSNFDNTQRSLGLCICCATRSIDFDRSKNFCSKCCDIKTARVKEYRKIEKNKV